MCTSAKREKVLFVRLPQDAHRALKIRAAEEGTTLTRMVDRVVARVLAGEKRRPMAASRKRGGAG